jgi:hypothetical protein
MHTVAVALYAMRRDHVNKTAVLISMAKQLRRLNNYALRARYGDRPKPLPRDIFPSIAAANEWLETASAGDILGIVECFKYQCSEGECETRPEWPMMLDIVASARIDAQGKPSSAVWSI